MECGDTISFDALLRRVTRVAGDTMAVAFNMESPGVMVGLSCGDNPTLTNAAALVVDDMVQVNYGQGTIEDTTALGCEEANVPLSVLFAEALAVAADGTNRILVFDVSTLDPLAPMDCDTDAPLSAEQMVRATFAMVGGQRSVLVVQADGFSPMPCDLADIGLEELVKRLLARVGPQQFAWKFIQEA